MSAFDPGPLLAELEAMLADAQLSDDERRQLSAALREASPPEDGLRQLRKRAFDIARQQSSDPSRTPAILRWLEGVMRALDTARLPPGSAGGLTRNQAYFSPGEDCLRAILAQLRAARVSLDLCVFTISDDRISEALIQAHRRGVQLRLITDNDKELDAGSDVSRLRAAGIDTRVDRTRAHMHHKFALVDGQWLLNGSYNWTRSAAESNEENLVLSNDARLVASFREAFEALWQRLGR